jgi:hypothetical protein
LPVEPVAVTVTAPVTGGGGCPDPPPLPPPQAVIHAIPVNSARNSMEREFQRGPFVRLLVPASKTALNGRKMPATRSNELRLLALAERIREAGVDADIVTVPVSTVFDPSAV